MNARITNWFEPKTRTLYIVQGKENHERMRDILRGAKFSGVPVHSVNHAWVKYTRCHDPFAKEINLTLPEAPIKRITVRGSILAAMRGG